MSSYYTTRKLQALIRLIMFISVLIARRLYLLRNYRHHFGEEKLKTMGKTGKLNERLLLWFGRGPSPCPNKRHAPYSSYLRYEPNSSFLHTVSNKNNSKISKPCQAKWNRKKVTIPKLVSIYGLSEVWWGKNM